MHHSILNIDLFPQKLSQYPIDGHDYELFTSLEDLPKRISVYTSDLNIICSKINITGTCLKVQSSVTYPSGLPLEIKPPLTQSFIECVSSQNESISISLMNFTNTVSLEISLDECYEEDVQGICQKYFNRFKQAYKLLLKGLNSLGKMSKFSKHHKYLKKEQLKMKKQVINIIQMFSTPSKNQQRETVFPCSITRSALIKVQKLIQTQNNNTKQDIRRGNYCYVEPNKCLITESGNQRQYQQILAVKKLKNQSDLNLVNKLKRELSLVDQIKDPSYVCQYYNVLESSNIYMSYVPVSLRDYISRKKTQNKMDVSKIINLSKQIILGVKSLHESEIIHRDLKPENILISKENNQQKVHIIDFGDSVMFQTKLQQVSSLRLGCTFPYSPLQCILNNQNGFSNYQIDYWSINMILYEIAFGSLPFSFNPSISMQLLQEWNNDNIFSIYQIYRKKRGIAGIMEIVSLISISGLQVQQKKRLNLDQLESIINKIQLYYKNIVQYCQ